MRSPELAACLHDVAFHMCPSPRHGEVILASTKLPTWPCPDSELLALEALGRISKLPLRLGHITEISYTSLLKTSGPFPTTQQSLQSMDTMGAEVQPIPQSLRAHQSKPPGASLITRGAVRGTSVTSDSMLSPKPRPSLYGYSQPRSALQTRAHASPCQTNRRPRPRPAIRPSRRSSHRGVL